LKKENPKLKNELNLGFFYRLFYNALNSECAKTMGFKPSECLVIEDSVSDVTAAKLGGFDVFGYTEHDYNNELDGIATNTFNNMEKLLEMI
jgi:beta-phosphoglucomutase-like phosphatase (HAD superfamily)